MMHPKNLKVRKIIIRRNFGPKTKCINNYMTMEYVRRFEWNTLKCCRFENPTQKWIKNHKNAIVTYELTDTHYRRIYINAKEMRQLRKAHIANQPRLVRVNFRFRKKLTQFILGILFVCMYVKSVAYKKYSASDSWHWRMRFCHICITIIGTILHVTIYYVCMYVHSLVYSETS